MMADVDALSRRYGELLGTHLAMSQCLKIRDMKQRPASYRLETFIDSKYKFKFPQTVDIDQGKEKPIYTKDYISQIGIICNASPTAIITTNTPATSYLVTSPLLLRNQYELQVAPNLTGKMKNTACKCKKAIQ